MAKVAFSKLDAKICNSVCNVCYNNEKGESVSYEVKSYLPISKKIELISNVINLSADENGYYNPIRIKIFTVLEVVQSYTNLSFTEKQKEDPFKLYDLLVSTGIFQTVIDNISKEDWTEIENSIMETIKSIYAYRNSIMGILDAVSSDYSNLNLDAHNIQQALADPNNMELLRNVLTKLG